EKLREALEARGARVLFAECYRRVRPGTDPAQLHQALERGEVDAVLVHSAETPENFLAIAGDAAHAGLAKVALVVPHGAIAGHADSLRFARTLVAAPGTSGIIETLSSLRTPAMAETSPPAAAKPATPSSGPSRRGGDSLARLLAALALAATAA